MRLIPHTAAARGIAAVAVAAALVGGVSACSGEDSTTTPRPTTAASATNRPDAYERPTAGAVAELPEARYDAVVPGLLASRATTLPDGMDTVAVLSADAPLYGADRTEPVARFAAKDFLGEDTVVVPVREDGPWTLVLTPARRSLPSRDPAAPAQTAAWIRGDLLHTIQHITDHVVIHVRQQTVSIVGPSGAVDRTFSGGVGTDDTPTPAGVGYLQARYLDPAQGQSTYPIELTSLHSAAADEPFGGSDGGLIGIHYQPQHAGAVSHGCVRLDGPSIQVLNQLPLGTPVVITP